MKNAFAQQCSNVLANNFHSFIHVRSYRAVVILSMILPATLAGKNNFP